MESDEKLISIIVPVYNTEAYLRECIDSILNQKYKNIQVIIVDDGSTDGCREICDEYAKLDNRVEVLHLVNGGLVKARKEGLKLAKGSYTGFVDSDDYIENDMYYKLVEAIENTEADFVHSGYNEVFNGIKKEYVNFDSNLFILNEEKQRSIFLKTFLLNIKDGKTISYSVWSKLFRTELIKNCYNKVSDKQSFGEDAICLFHCIFNSKKIAFVQLARYNYRIRNNSLSHMSDYILFTKQVKLCGEILKVIEEYGYLDTLRKEQYEFLLSSLLPIIKVNQKKKFKISQFYIDYIELLKGKKVAIYGAGCVGEDIYEQLNDNKINIVCVIDRDFVKKDRFGVRCIGSDKIQEPYFDYIIIAVLDEMVALEIRDNLLNIGVAKEKIIWKKPKRYY